MPGNTSHNTGQFDEEALIKRLQQGDSAAFMELYNYYHPAIYNFILRIIKNPVITEDLLQEVFIKIWSVRERIQPGLSFQAYLYRISRNAAFKMLKKMAADNELRLMLMNELHRSANDADNKARWVEYEKLLNAAIEQLPPQRQKIFRLCRQEGKTYRDVSFALNISPNTVKEHMVLATRSIRAFLSRHGEIFFFLTPTLFPISGI